MKKQQKKNTNITKMNEDAYKVHLQELFSAVENNHLDKARTIIETCDLDINCLNMDGFSILDLSVLSNNRSMTKMLLSHGANESSTSASENIGDKLINLLKIAETKVENLKTNTDKFQSSQSSTLTSENAMVLCSTSNENEVKIWERRVKALKRLLLGWNQTEAPEVASSIEIGVSGITSIYLKILEPLHGAIATKFKVQLSHDSNFTNITGEYEFSKWSTINGTMGVKQNIENLIHGKSYYLRTSSGNMKGWGPYKCSNPSNIILSSWRDINVDTETIPNNQDILNNLCTSLRLIRQKDSLDFTAASNGTLKKPKRKNTLKNFFSYPFKFHKNLKRSIYFASIIYNEDKILVTSDDFLPVIEIDESYPKSFQNDYCWITKVSLYWEGIKSLQSDLERNTSSTFNFRAKLLSSFCQMQSALGLLDLGILYYKPLRDQNGAIVITCIQNVQNQKDVSLPNSRWISVRKMQGSSSVSLEEHSISKKLILSLQDQIRYHQSLNQELSPGLYIGYLNILCSVEQIKVIVPVQTPNVLPHCKIRENSFLTAEEWHLLKYGIKIGDINESTYSSYANNKTVLTEVQTLFCIELINAIRKLFAFMNIQMTDDISHRIYDVEVIEFSNNISFLIICPSVELNSATLESDLLLQRDDLISVNIHVFEILHFYTYQHDILQKYIRLYCILEMETILVTRSHREAFSTSELRTSKDKLDRLNELTTELNNLWNNLRWLMKIIAFARNKKEQSSEVVKHILNHINNNFEDCIDLKCLFKVISETTWTDGRNVRESSSINYKSNQQIKSISSNFSRKKQKSLSPSYRNSVSDTSESSMSKAHKSVMNFKISSVSSNSSGSSGSRQGNNLTDFGRKYTDSSHLTQCCPIPNFSLETDNNGIPSTSLNVMERSNYNCLKTNSTLEEKINVDMRASFPNSNSISYQNVENNSINNVCSTKNQTSGIIQVFTAYDTGLASGTSLKLHVTANTTSREVINLVVKQLNMAVILRGSKGPIHEMNKLHTFCLVAVIGARERCLRDDFKPLKLQNPWKKGRLYVRKKTDLLAALEHACQDSYFN